MKTRFGYRGKTYSSICIVLFVSLYIWTPNTLGSNVKNPQVARQYPSESSSEAIIPCYEKEPIFKYTMKIFPEVISPGDSIFLRLDVTNIRGRGSYNVGPRDMENMEFIISAEGIPGEYQLVSERCTDDILGHPVESYKFVHGAGETWSLMNFCTSIPSLDDLDLPFWQQVRNKLAIGNLTCKIRFKSGQYSCLIHDIPDQECSFTLTRRVPEEMKMIQAWYRNTPPQMFPIPASEYYPKRKNKNIASPLSKILRSEFSRSEKNWITIRNQQYSPRSFMLTHSRYPGDPNCPETWQGWKELEESLTPSTMRDEIRMTRIVIQYCDTEDSKVLDELTEWLQNMNEIQRVVMVQNVMNLQGKLSQDGEVRKPLLQLIETIKPFAAEELPAEIRLKRENNLLHTNRFGHMSTGSPRIR